MLSNSNGKIVQQIPEKQPKINLEKDRKDLFDFLRSLLISHGSLETLRCNFDDLGNITIYTSYLSPNEVAQLITSGKDKFNNLIQMFNHNISIKGFERETQFGKEYYNINMNTLEVLRPQGMILVRDDFTEVY